jgi:hypothetical protein
MLFLLLIRERNVDYVLKVNTVIKAFIYAPISFILISIIGKSIRMVIIGKIEFLDLALAIYACFLVFILAFDLMTRISKKWNIALIIGLIVESAGIINKSKEGISKTYCMNIDSEFIEYLLAALSIIFLIIMKINKLLNIRKRNHLTNAST